MGKFILRIFVVGMLVHGTTMLFRAAGSEAQNTSIKDDITVTHGSSLGTKELSSSLLQNISPTNENNWTTGLFDGKPTRSVPSGVHYDNEYKYNYRTGYSGDYEYNYDVDGYNDEGEYVYGNIDVSGKYGSGYVYDEEGNEIYVDVEWVDYGELEAFGENGEWFDLGAY